MTLFKPFFIKLIKALFFVNCIIHMGYGHAHIFIDYKVHGCLNDNGLEGVYVNWTFDRMFAAFIKKEFDKDKNGVFSKEEQKNIFNTAFQSLKKNNYFTVIQVNGKNCKIPEPQQFSARLIKEKDVVAYTFYIPLNIKANKKEQKVQVYFFDPVIYVAFTVMKKDISIQNKSVKIDANISLKTVKYTNRPTILFKER